jgi:short-subunit dehydrogenase
MEKLVETVIQAYGQVDVLVNNAGLSMGGAFQEQDPAVIRQMINLNVYTPLRLTQLVLPHMLDKKQGHVVNVASVAGLTFMPGQAAYSPTRAAIVAFSKSLRRELDGTGVRVSYVLPGWTATAMLERMPVSEMRANGLLPPFTCVDQPEVPARAILEAVRRNRPRTQLGGLGWAFADLYERLSPAWMDFYTRIFLDKEKLLRGMQDLGV